MIEQAIKTELEALTGLPVYPLLLPADVVEGITYQCVSDPPLEIGLVRTSVVRARFQIRIIILNDYTRLKTLDRQIWGKWQTIRHGFIADFPVQYVERGSLRETPTPQTSNQQLYDLLREYFITYVEVSP